jgi:hypothetical protein
VSGRISVSWGTVGAELARVVAAEAPAWVRPDTRAALERAVGLLRRDMTRVVEAAPSRDVAAVELDVGRRALYRWLSGWLSEGA